MEIVKKTETLFTRFSMFVLAASPILDLYKFCGTKLTYANVMAIITLLICTFGKSIKLNILPNTYLLYWGWVAGQIYFIVGIGGWSDYLPGGIYMTLFSLSLIIFASGFEITLLYKYMRKIFIFSSVLFLIQFVYYIITKQKISMFLPLGSQLSYANMSYDQLVKIHMTYQGTLIERFCSIFAEPSHFAQYCLVLLAIELFLGENKEKLYTKFSLYLIPIIILIESGVGLVGLGIIGIIKIIHLIKTNKNKKKYSILMFLIPALIFAISQILESSFGAYISSRAAEFNNADQGGSVRLYYGWNSFLDSDIRSMIVGSSRAVTIEGWDASGFYNGVTYVLILQGIIGAGLLLLFFITTCRKLEFEYISLAIIFLVISLIGATYCSPLMLIVSSAIVGGKLNYNKLCRM